MKSTEFLTRFALILFVKNINGQNGLVYDENCECNGLGTMQQPIPSYAIVKTIQDVMNQNENTAALADTQQIRVPPDLQQQPLQVQQYLQLGKPSQLQQAPPLQQPLQVQPPTQVQPLKQSQLSFDTIQPLMPLQTQDILQLQPLRKQPQLQSSQPRQSYRPVQPLQSLELQQLQQPKQLQTPQSLTLQQTVSSLDSSQPLNAMQQPLGFRQFYSQTPLMIPECKNGPTTRDTPLNQNINNNQPNSQINIKWQSTNPLGAINSDNPYTQNLNIQPRQAFTNSPIEVMATVQTSKNKPQEIPSLTNYMLSQRPVSSSVASVAPVVSNCQSIAPKLSIPIEIPLATSYNYMLPSLPTQSTNTQFPYYNPATDLQNNKYNNPNSILRYEQSTLPVVVQRQPNPFVQSQSSMLPAIPFSIPQAPTIPSQYVVSSGYPVGTVVAPSNTRNKSVSSSLKSILPIILQLLKEKIATCGCNDSPCDCKNDKNDNEIDVACGYSSLKDYGHLAKDALPVLDTVSKEEQGPECLREAKNCEEIKNATRETSGELSEEENSDEVEIEEDEDN